MHKKTFFYLSLATAVLLLALSSKAGSACANVSITKTISAPGNSQQHQPVMLHQGIINF